MTPVVTAARATEPWQDGSDGFASAYEADKKRLIGFFRAHGLTPAESEDLADETVLRTLIHLKRHGQTQEHLGPLTKTIARNLLIERRRKTSAVAVVPLTEGHEFPDETLDPFERAAETERREAVRRAVDSLSPRNRHVVTLWMSGRTPTEIARELGVKRNAVDAILHRAKRGLASRLGPRSLWGLAGLVFFRVRSGVRDGMRFVSSHVATSTTEAALSLAAVAVATAISASSAASGPTVPATPKINDVPTTSVVEQDPADAPVAGSASLEAPAPDRVVPAAKKLEKQEEVDARQEIDNPTTGEKEDVGADLWFDHDPENPTEIDRLYNDLRGGPR